jgi:hypothetical protein
MNYGETRSLRVQIGADILRRCIPTHARNTIFLSDFFDACFARVHMGKPEWISAINFLVVLDTWSSIKKTFNCSTL